MYRPINSVVWTINGVPTLIHTATASIIGLLLLSHIVTPLIVHRVISPQWELAHYHGQSHPCTPNDVTNHYKQHRYIQKASTKPLVSFTTQWIPYIKLGTTRTNCTWLQSGRYKASVSHRNNTMGMSTQLIFRFAIHVNVMRGMYIQFLVR